MSVGALGYIAPKSMVVERLDRVIESTTRLKKIDEVIETAQSSLKQQKQDLSAREGDRRVAQDRLAAAKTHEKQVTLETDKTEAALAAAKAKRDETSAKLERIAQLKAMMAKKKMEEGKRAS